MPYILELREYNLELIEIENLKKREKLKVEVRVHIEIQFKNS